MVAAIMLANGRPEMVKRAIASFRAQTYPAQRRGLFVLDTGATSLPDSIDTGGVVHWKAPGVASKPIGELRNIANRIASAQWSSAADVQPKLICHFDSDDWSHPDRIAEQVKLLQASGKECVGYRDLLFWDTRGNDPRVLNAVPGSYYETCPVFGAAYRFQSDDARYLIGASMMYTVEAWHRYPFTTTSHHYEDQDWWSHNNSRTLGVAAFDGYSSPGYSRDPRMVCGIHGTNTSEAYQPENMHRKQTTGKPAWTRVPGWDSYCSSRMAL